MKAKCGDRVRTPEGNEGEVCTEYWDSQVVEVAIDDGFYEIWAVDDVEVTEQHKSNQ